MLVRGEGAHYVSRQRLPPLQHMGSDSGSGFGSAVRVPSSRELGTLLHHFCLLSNERASPRTDRPVPRHTGRPLRH